MEFQFYHYKDNGYKIFSYIHFYFQKFINLIQCLCLPLCTSKISKTRILGYLAIFFHNDFKVHSDNTKESFSCNYDMSQLYSNKSMFQWRIMWRTFSCLCVHKRLLKISEKTPTFCCRHLYSNLALESLSQEFSFHKPSTLCRDSARKINFLESRGR